MKPAAAAFAIGLAAWGGYRAWQSHERVIIDRQLQAVADVYGFAPVRMPDGAPAHTVLILAPLNCPSDGAQRAESLAAKLESLGIPHERRNQYSVARATPAERAEIERAFMVMNGTIPAVMLDGQAKANPTVDEVTAEFHKND